MYDMINQFVKIY